MSKTKILNFEIANFVCKFGDENLLDHFIEKIYPIFNIGIDSNRGETYGFKFTNVTAQTINGTPCIVGRFVQRLRIRARQTLNKNLDDITPSNATMLSDPSSIFVLKLTDHRLFLVREIPRSPKIKQFYRVVDQLVFDLWKTEYTSSLKLYKESINKRRLTKEEREEFDRDYEVVNPRPFFQLTSIADSEKSATLIEDEFALVKSISVRAYKTNNEDGDADEELLDLHRKKMEQMRGDTGDINYKNSKDGLDKESVKKLVHAASSTSGNATYKVQGTSKDGHAITRTESDSKIQLTTQIPTNYTISDVAKAVISKANEIINNKTLKITKTVITQTEISQANSIIKKIENLNE